MPRTGLEPARLAALVPETSASTIPPPGLCECKVRYLFLDVQVFGEIFLREKLKSEVSVTGKGGVEGRVLLLRE